MAVPLVSILIPCFNAERYIGEALDCCLGQSWPNVEVIVVDDGSEDSSCEVVQAYLSRGVKLFTQANGGASSARNKAYSVCSGEYIQFLDADDLISHDKTLLQVRRLEQNPGAIACCTWGRFSRCVADVRIDPYCIRTDLTPVDWLVRCWSRGAGMLFPAMWMIPRGVIERGGLWRNDLSLNDDGEFFTRMVLNSTSVLSCPKAVAYYRSGIPGSLSGSRSPAAWQSGFKALQSCVSATLQIEDSERVRRCAALLWQVYAHGAYPYDAQLANEALRLASELHSVSIRPEGGFAYHVLSRVVGWKAARTIQHWYGRP